VLILAGREFILTGRVGEVGIKRYGVGELASELRADFTSLVQEAHR